jgi:hypothetical protein
MQNTLVRLSAEPTRTRLLITQGVTDIGKAVLPPSSSAHPRATATLLEGLSLFLNERLCVVLCVDEQSTSCGSLGLLDALGYGERSLFYDVGVAARVSRADRRRAERVLHLAGGGDFRDLRQLGWEWPR